LFSEEGIFGCIEQQTITLASKRPHTRSDTSWKKAQALSDLERLVSKRFRRPKTPFTPSPTLSAPSSSSTHIASKHSPFIDQELPFTSTSF